MLIDRILAAKVAREHGPNRKHEPEQCLINANIAIDHSPISNDQNYENRNHEHQNLFCASVEPRLWAQGHRGPHSQKDGS